jgi:hypothetical protein
VTRFIYRKDVLAAISYVAVSDRLPSLARRRSQEDGIHTGKGRTSRRETKRLSRAGQMPAAYHSHAVSGTCGCAVVDRRVQVAPAMPNNANPGHAQVPELHRVCSPRRIQSACGALDCGAVATGGMALNTPTGLRCPIPAARETPPVAPRMRQIGSTTYSAMCRIVSLSGGRAPRKCPRAHCMSRSRASAQRFRGSRPESQRTPHSYDQADLKHGSVEHPKATRPRFRRILTSIGPVLSKKPKPNPSAITRRSSLRRP